MFGLFEGAEARRLPGQLQVPWHLVGWSLVLLLLLAVRIDVPSVTLPLGETTNPVAVSQSPDAQSVQQAPQQNIAVVPVDPTLKWEKIGEASNGGQVMTLSIPWDQLFQYESQGGDPVIWEWLKRVNPPQGYEVPGTFAGYRIEGYRVIVYGYASQDAHTLSYWKAEENLNAIEGLSP